MAEDNNLSKHFYSVIPIQELEKIEEVKGDESPINKEGEDLIPIGLKNRENITNAISLAQLQSLIDTNTSNLAGENGAGLMSVEDKNKLDSITEATSAQSLTIPAKGGLMSNEDKEHLDWLYNNIDNLGIKNLKDGIATGSLRGIFTVEETDSYTLGQNTVTLGENTKASSKGQTVIGRNNTVDTQGDTNNYGKYAFIVGNGNSESARSNAMAVAWNGNVEVAGNISINGTPAENNHLATISYTNTAIEEAEVSINETINNSMLKNLKDGEVLGSLQSTNISTASGQYSFAEGYNTEAIGDYSHTSGIGTIAINDNEFVIGSYNKYSGEDLQVIETPFIGPSIDYLHLTKTYTLNNDVKSETIISFYFIVYDNTGHEGGDIITPQTNLDFTAGSLIVKHFNANLEEVDTSANALFSISYNGSSTITFYGTTDALNNYSVHLKKIIYIKPSSFILNNLFVIGNGTDDDHRSNVLTVSKTGDLYVNGNIYTHDFSTGNNINFVDKIYPVGSIYMSVNNTDPSILFGGIWRRIQDKFLLAAGSTYNAGDIGGEATHKLTEFELPNIAGAFVMRKLNNGSTQGPLSVNYSGHFKNGTDTSGNVGQGVSWGPSGQLKGHSVIFEFGSNGDHNNMPPYLAVYIWQRIS